jgi:NTE family protein
VSQPSAPSGPRVGLVLGGGANAGIAHHIGALLALHTDLGWDPRQAEVIVGTSAGSIVATLLRAGCSPEDLAAWCAEVDPSEEGVEARPALDLVRAARPKASLPAMEPLNLMLMMRLAAAHHRRDRIQACLAPRGFLRVQDAMGPLGAVMPDGWPKRPLWITAVRRHDARFVVLGRDRQDVPVPRAVAASCAVPGLFAPVRFHRSEYVDGGVRSPTSADVLAGLGLDLVIVSSPMSGPWQCARGSSNRRMRRHARASLRWEVAKVEASGTPVHVIEPSEAELAVIGRNPFDTGRMLPVAREAFFSAGAAHRSWPEHHPLERLAESA